MRYDKNNKHTGPENCSLLKSTDTIKISKGIFTRYLSRKCPEKTRRYLMRRLIALSSLCKLLISKASRSR